MRKENLRTIIYLFFLISGMTGLIFQVTWFKYLSLFLGNTTFAQTIVLATFLGGLAIGNYLIGRWADTIKSQLMYYGLIELLIGVYCVLFPTISSVSEKLFFSVANENLLLNNSYTYLLIKFFISALVLIIPTTLMGGTLPLLTKFFTDKIENIRKENANLYFLNSFGAVVGVFFAGFILIKTFGLDITIKIGGFFNILIGLISIFLNTYFNDRDENKAEIYESTLPNEANEILPKSTIKIIILIGGLSGFASLMYEVLWTRILIAVFGSSTYSFSLMLMAFISGITFGSFIASSNFISKLNRVNLLIFSQLMIALTILIAQFILPLLPYYFWKLSNLFSRTNEAFTLFLSFEFIICFSLIFIPTIFMGITLPLIVEIVAKQKGLVGYSVGTVFSVNTLGNVLGAISSGLVLIPLIGVKNSFLFGVLINLLAAISLLAISLKFIALKYKYLSFSSAIVIIILIFFVPNWNEELMTSSVFRRLSDTPPLSYQDFKRIFQSREIIFFKDGASGNVSVIRTLDSLHQKILLINGKPDASSVGDMPTQLLLGHIPMILHPNPKNVFVIGLGSGSTINAVLKHNPDNVICSEISKEVVEASKLFADVNENALNDKRLKLIVEDAQSYLKMTNQKFDVIISEPSNPWIAGIGNLFSKEYFERCKEKLNPNGIMCQWFHIYEMDDEVLRLVLSTFNSVFPYVQTWGGNQGDLILIGSEEPNIDINTIVQNFNSPEVKNNLSKIGIGNLFTFLTNQILSPEGSFTLTNDRTINSEKKPTLEFLAPVAFYKGTTSILVYQNDEKFDTLNPNLLVKKYIQTFKISDKDILNAIEYNFTKAKNIRLVYGLSSYLLQKDKSNLSAAINKFLTEAELKIIKYNTLDLSKSFSINDESNYLAGFFANQLIAENVNATTFLKVFPIDEAEKILVKHHNSEKLSDFKFYAQLASIFLKNSQPDKSLQYCLKAEEILKNNPELMEKIDLSEFFYTFATAALYLDNYGKVIEYFIQLANYNQNFEPKKILSKKIEWRVRENKKKSQKLMND